MLKKKVETSSIDIINENRNDFIKVNLDVENVLLRIQSCLKSHGDINYCHFINESGSNVIITYNVINNSVISVSELE